MRADHAHTLLGGEQTEFTTFPVATIFPANSFTPTFSTNASLSGNATSVTYNATNKGPEVQKDIGAFV